MTEVAVQNCIDIVAPFNEAVGSRGLADIQIMGGIGSAALTQYHTVIIPSERRVVTTDEFLEDPDCQEALQPVRGDGSLRDLDVLVLETDQLEIDLVEQAAEDTVDGALDISVFGLHDAAELRRQVAEPFGWSAVKTFVSDRYVWDGGRVDKALFPFAVELEPEALETWTLEIGDHEFPIANPASTVLNYLTRSISGLRPKDAEKVYMMADRVFNKAPELLEWTLDGPGQSQMELAGILHTLRRGNSWPPSKRTLDISGAINLRAGSVRALHDHEAFMLKEDDSATRDAVLLWSVVKARALGMGESQEGIVKLFRKHFEGRVDGITKNSAAIGS